MKTAVLAAAGLGLANASMRSLLGNIENYLAQNANKTGRAFSGVAENAFAPINGYGCWCYLDDTWRDANQVLINRPAILAHGKTVDEIDESCKDLINSYKCIEMDAEKNGIDDCDAQAVPYVGWSFIGDVTTDCQTKNPGNECAANACIVEGAFTAKYIQYMGLGAPSITTDPGYDANYVHTTKNGPFDPEVNCPGIPNPVGSDKDCCGEHSQLTRHPYRLYSGFTTRSCCNNQVLNNELERCCVVSGVETVFEFNDSCP